MAMFEFSPDFDRLSNEIIYLQLSETCIGDSCILPFYYYDIHLKSSNVKIGKISMRIGENYNSYYNGHIGYEVDSEYRGQGIACEACRLVLPIAKRHGMSHVYVTCAESNGASRKTIEKLNVMLQAVVSVPADCFFWREGMEKYCIYRLEL